MTNTLSEGTTAKRRLTSVLKHDLPASLVVFLVAMPLALGIAVAAGAPLAAGVVAACAGGILASALGGSAVQVSGPAAGMAVVVADLIQTYGWRATCMITLLAGVVQFLLGVCRVARAALAVSPAVLHGMLAGVGVVIALSQLHMLLGGAGHGSPLDNLAALPALVIGGHPHAVAVGLLTIGVLLGWNRLPRRVRALPAPLAALLVAASVAAVLDWDVTHLDLSQNLGEWAPPVWPAAEWPAIAASVLLVALLAGVESLLSSVGIDKIHDGPRADLDRELTGQGVANIVSGALGGLPVAGGILRSTANVRAGGRTRWSAILNGVWVLVFACWLGWTVQMIPMEALAALLVFIGVRMVKPGHIPQLRGHGEVPVYVVTFLGVVLVGLAEGVLMGLGLAAVLALHRLTWVTIRLRPEPGGRWHVLIAGSLTFLGVPRITAGLREIPPAATVNLDLNIDFMDNAAFEALHAWRLEHERSGGTVDIDEIHDEWYAMAASGARMFPAKTPLRGPDHWWLPWAYRRPRAAGYTRPHPHRPPGLGHRPGSGRPEPVRETPTALDQPPPGPPGGGPVAPELLAGAREFHRRTAPLIRPILTRMARKQEPSHLFITCADSRVVPSLITASGPGDLFTVRNIGNLVPRKGAAPSDDSVVAAIEFATQYLNVRTITVCGHSGCGAMAVLLSGGVTAGEMPGLQRWLRHGGHTLSRFIEGEPRPDDGLEPLDRLCRVNVMQQLANLHTYPQVNELVAAGRMELVGLYFDIPSARVHVLDRERFSPVGVPGQRIG
ncbi:carbonic anhydrase [Microtetraspora sp. NBRC 13810]|uniref:SulP family inorganic anion transporter n=1 Tax=Microtetraspora sp. NBRC 13810 TaxID=3030990 RepID=UPI0024A3A5A3|nr:SulP family inorganic anion transporter [Microtetraspora sp. NBRC 13810]GLW07766.1 carbonic anhydrase [Microtetraspora sp. NBRC 13810]